MVNFPIHIPDCDSHSPAHLDFFLSSDASICSTVAFLLLGNSYLVVISISFDFLSKSKWDTPFHNIAYDYSHTLDGLCDHWRDVPLEDIFKLSTSAVAAHEFCEWVQVWIDLYIIHQLLNITA